MVKSVIEKKSISSCIVLRVMSRTKANNKDSKEHRAKHYTEQLKMLLFFYGKGHINALTDAALNLKPEPII